MKPLSTSLGCLLLAWSGQAAAQTLQLPTFQFFATDSSVLVPDQGRASLGGVNRAANGSTQFGGLPGNRSSGRAAQAGGLSITAQIHDFEEHDRAVLAAAARRRGSNGGLQASARRNEPGAAEPTGSVAQIAAQRLQAQHAAEREASDYFARGEQAETAGKLRVARVYFQMSARHAAGELRRQALARAAAVSTNLTALADGQQAQRFDRRPRR